MNKVILYSLLIITSFVIITCIFYNKKVETFTDNEKNNRNLREGFLSYHKRLFTKYIHRPLKFRARKIHKKIKSKFDDIKRKIF